MTGQYATLGNDPVGPAITMVAQADYHLAELDRVAAALDALGLATRIVVPVIAWKPMYSRRPTVRRLRQLVATSGRVLAKPISVRDLVARSSAVLVMNDWGVPRELIDLARQAGVPNAALVEGVQDYADIDTGLARHAYRRVDHVFTLGPDSAANLGRERCTPVGSERVLSLWSQPATPAAAHVLINSNFTYGVMPKVRRGWVDGAVGAAEDAGQPWVLSRHTAERGRSRHRVDRRPVDALLATSSYLVSRFSTVALDALALGVELIYHNPHHEQEPTFQTEVQGFVVTRSVSELQDRLAAAPRDRSDVRAAAEPFLRRHVLLDPANPPASLVAAGLAGMVK